MTLVVPEFAKLKVLVAGDAMLDEYWFGDTARISPEAPVPVVRVDSESSAVGGAGASRHDRTATVTPQTAENRTNGSASMGLPWTARSARRR